MFQRAKCAVTVTALAAGVASLSACGDPISANRDWQAYTSAVTVTSTVAQPGSTIKEQEQILIGKVAVGNNSDGNVLPKTTLQVTCGQGRHTQDRIDAGPGPAACAGVALPAVLQHRTALLCGHGEHS